MGCRAVTGRSVVDLSRVCFRIIDQIADRMDRKPGVDCKELRATEDRYNRQEVSRWDLSKTQIQRRRCHERRLQVCKQRVAVWNSFLDNGGSNRAARSTSDIFGHKRLPESERQSLRKSPYGNVLRSTRRRCQD